MFVIVSSHDVLVVVSRDAALENVISDLESRGFIPDTEKRPPPPPKREAAAAFEDARVRALETDLTHARERSVMEN